MTNRDELKRKMRAENFFENNGDVMRALNVGGIEYHPLKTVRKVLPELTEIEFLKSINYLQLKGYIMVRRVDTHQITEIADAEYTLLESRLSAKGIDLTGAIIPEDPAVPV